MKNKLELVCIGDYSVNAIVDRETARKLLFKALSKGSKVTRFKKYDPAKSFVL